MFWDLLAFVIAVLLLLGLAALAFVVLVGRSPIDIVRNYFQERTKAVVLGSEGSDSVRAPVSGRQCIHYRLTVEALRKHQLGSLGQRTWNRDRRWVNVVDESYGVPVRATTLDGHAVELPSALEVEGTAEWQGGAPASLKNLLGDELGWGAVRWRELLVHDRDGVDVTGVWSRHEHGFRVRPGAKGRVTLTVRRRAAPRNARGCPVCGNQGDISRALGRGRCGNCGEVFAA